MAQYGKKEYWDERYTKDPDAFDWYQRYPALKEILGDLVQVSHKILNVGCGNSRLSEDMYEDGYHSIENVDISSIVIKGMQEKHADKPGMAFRQMNVLDMKEFSDGQFDTVIDKGTMDSILCGQDSTRNVQTMLKEIFRVLKPSGQYVCVTYGQPSYRMTYLQRPELGWKVDIKTVQKQTMAVSANIQADEKDNVHYIYVCTKTAEGEHKIPMDSENSPTEEVVA